MRGRAAPSARRWGRILLVATAVLLGLALVMRGPTDARPDQSLPSGDWDAAARGAWQFRNAGFGGLAAGPLETHAIPWRLSAAALILDAKRGDRRVPLDRAALRPILQRYGFLFPSRVGNWPDGMPTQPSGTLPLGMTHGVLSPIRGLPVSIANLGCAACHAGATYDAKGDADPDRAWLGMPNSSIDLEGYTRAVFTAMRRQVRDPDRLLRATATIFPEMRGRERFALRWLVLPRVKKRLTELGQAPRPLPFPNGLPGSTNGVAALKQALGTPLAGGGAGELGFVSVPDLGQRDWRRSLLTDGAYAVPGEAAGRAMEDAGRTSAHREALATITTFFTVPSMGVHPDRAERSLGEAREVGAFLATYRAQPFPGRIDARAAAQGAVIYARACASCHGSYSGSARPKLTRFPNWIGDVGTDPLRANLFDAALVDAVNTTRYAQRMTMRAGNGYAAPPLAGIWASAPYLHNGSVPTIAALLDPSRRPTAFMVGGHSLDFTALGLRLAADGRYPAGSRPWAGTAWIDTRKPGLSNDGHVFGSDLTEPEKRALIAFLKLL
ncbi:c-type cytochrome [Sphingomonas sp. ST-64]|uniref:C-type cytochrome n=1 Tax=Sphingomonas plantiphila TaxID=3163295 RepID=A0ABW8YNK3_9SPHN